MYEKKNTWYVHEQTVEKRPINNRENQRRTRNKSEQHHIHEDFLDMNNIERRFFRKDYNVVGKKSSVQIVKYVVVTMVTHPKLEMFPNWVPWWFPMWICFNNFFVNLQKAMQMHKKSLWFGHRCRFDTVEKHEISSTRQKMFKLSEATYLKW